MHKLKIAILFHQQTYRFRIDKYSINYLASVWNADGHEVIFLFGTDKFVPADICIVHVDLSVVPDEYLEFARRYPRVLNGSVKSIQKSHFSKNLVNAEDSYSGKVIVKSNDNYAGWPELILTRSPISIIRARLQGRFGKGHKYFASSADYIVYDHLSEVPGSIFRDPYFVVEKFKPEVIDCLYFTTAYVFLGESHQCFRESSRHPIVKYTSIVTSESIAPDPEIIKIRRAMNFDYGKFDFCYHNGELVLLDINKTTGMGSIKYAPLYEQRALALYKYFDTENNQGIAL